MEYRWVRRTEITAAVIGAIAIVFAAWISKPSDSPKLQQAIKGSNNPAINDVDGDVNVNYGTINYHGASPAIVARLEELLNKKDIELAQQQQVIDQWIERHNDLQQELAKRPGCCGL